MNTPVSPSPVPGEMIVERARVLRVADGVAWVHCESQAGCARCAAGEGCGAGLFAKLLRGRLQELPVALPGGFATLAADDWVLIGLSVGAVQNASLLLYGLPLAGLLLGAVAGALPGGGDAGAFVGAVIGLGGGLWLARRAAARFASDASLQPLLLRRIVASEPCPARREA